jgi:hypothetical protein
MTEEELAAIEKRAEVLRRRGEPDQDQVFALIAEVRTLRAMLREVAVNLTPWGEYSLTPYIELADRVAALLKEKSPR